MIYSNSINNILYYSVSQEVATAIAIAITIYKKSSFGIPSGSVNE